MALAFVIVAGQTTASEDVHLSIASERKFYKADTTSEFFVETIVSAGSVTSQSTAPQKARSFVLVLDQSGSMAGPRINAVRQALNQTITGLRAHDIISVVAFGSEVKTLVDASRIDQIRKPADISSQLQPAGGAALFDALSQGAAQARRFVASATTTDLILVTDGPATKGPREADDFISLINSFVGEGIRVSTIGLGDAFEEDLLSNMARAGNGRFALATEPAQLPEVLHPLTSHSSPVVARDLVVTLDFRGFCDQLEAHGAFLADATSSSITFRLPYLFENQSISLLASARIWNSYAANGHQPSVVSANLSWIPENADATTPRQSRSAALPMRFETDPEIIRDSIQLGPFRRAVDALIGDGMQETIELIDKGNLKRALQHLRRTRSQVADLVEELDDDGLRERLSHLDAYVDDVETRGLGQLDRKILRSGLSNRFDPPTPAKSP
ncbi:MAG: VWA domain-containing protein [Synoicihabitans sp.]